MIMWALTAGKISRVQSKTISSRMVQEWQEIRKSNFFTKNDEGKEANLEGNPHRKYNQNFMASEPLIRRRSWQIRQVLSRRSGDLSLGGWGVVSEGVGASEVREGV